MKNSDFKKSKRELRAAAALRANLLRRKQQARLRQKNQTADSEQHKTGWEETSQNKE